MSGASSPKPHLALGEPRDRGSRAVLPAPPAKYVQIESVCRRRPHVARPPTARGPRDRACSQPRTRAARPHHAPSPTRAWRACAAPASSAQSFPAPRLVAPAISARAAPAASSNCSALPQQALSEAAEPAFCEQRLHARAHATQVKLEMESAMPKTESRLDRIERILEKVAKQHQQNVRAQAQLTRALENTLALSHPAWRAILTAPLDDQHLTPAAEAAFDQTLARANQPGIPHQDLLREFGLCE